MSVELTPETFFPFSSKKKVLLPSRPGRLVQGCGSARGVPPGSLHPCSEGPVTCERNENAA